MKGQQQQDQVYPLNRLVGEMERQGGGGGGTIMHTDAGGRWNLGGEGFPLVAPH